MAKKEKTVKTKRVVIPHDPTKPEDDAVEVYVNDKAYTIQRDTEVEVPEAVAEAIQNAERTRRMARRHRRAIVNNDI